VTIGGNDVGYVPLLFAAGLPRVLRALPVLGGRFDTATIDRALAEVADALRDVGRAVRTRAPAARVLFVDYLTLLPPPGTPARPLSDSDAETGRRVADELARATAEAAADTGCELVGAARHSTAHHAWSAEPWTTRFGLPLPGRPAPLHPNALGMRMVADLVVAQVSGRCGAGSG
jgi:lysophospholipase L1-like esterase